MDDDKGGGFGPEATATRWPQAKETAAERLSVNRGYLQQTLVRKWNSCARAGCGYDFKHHPSDRGGGPCSAFVSHDLRPYLTEIANWERPLRERAKARHEKMPNALEIEPSGVIIPAYQRPPMGDADEAIATKVLGWTNWDEALSRGGNG